MANDSSKCKGTNKQGLPCGAAATASGYCYLHSDPARASQLGREGGRRNRHFIDDTTRPLPKLNSVSGIREAISMIIEDVYAGRVNPRKAAAMAPLLGPLLRAMTGAEMEERLKTLESALELVSREMASKYPGNREGSTASKQIEK